jgi:hypothetical protein
MEDMQVCAGCQLDAAVAIPKQSQVSLIFYIPKPFVRVGRHNGSSIVIGIIIYNNHFDITIGLGKRTLNRSADHAGPVIRRDTDGNKGSVRHSSNPAGCVSGYDRT